MVAKKWRNEVAAEMQMKMIKNEFYEKLNEIYSSISGLLSNYCKSPILQNFCQSEVETLFYGNLVKNFFMNLNQKKIKELNLPKGKIGQIKKKYIDIQRDIKLAFSSSLKGKKVDEEYYDNFKLKIEKEFPEFLKIFIEIEKEIDIKGAKIFLKKKEDELKKIGKPIEDFDALIMTKGMEVYVQVKKKLPVGQDLKKLTKTAADEVLPKISKEIFKDLKKDSKKMLAYNKKCQKEFENRLYKRWKAPLTLLEFLIQISLESGGKQKEKLGKTTDKTNNFKRPAIINLHARAMQISNEILVLLKSGFADAAYARWRTLHELKIISFFLLDSNNIVSQRYLEHEVIRNFKEAKDYRECYKKLGYSPLDRKTFNKLKRENERLCKKYDDKFNKDYGWIPSSILKSKNFRTLEKHVKLDKYRHFYNLSCDAAHGGAKGFHRLGLMDIYQKKILLVGASNYGLADPILNTADSLFGVSICLLNLEPDFESILQLHIMRDFVNEIGQKAFKIQNDLKKKELDRFS
jgi:hypothetical protein